MSKYIIRNCPAYDYDEEFNYHICKQPLIPYECSVDDCQDCNDCVMKQVVERCREAQKEYPRHFPDGETDMFVSGRNNLAGIILALLDVQEVK